MSFPSNISSENISNDSFNHTKKYSFCGPKTKVQQRLKEGYQGVNTLDKACKQYDEFYSKYPCTKDRNRADDILAREATKISLDESKPQYERNDARLFTGIMGLESRFGTGLKKISEEVLTTLYYNPNYVYSGINDLASKSNVPSHTVENWLSKQKVYTLHKPIKHRFRTRRLLFLILIISGKQILLICKNTNNTTTT